MELRSAVVFTLVSLVSVNATPHGYGVKGGAVAKAEASAAAGAFSGVPGLPLSIPSGPGYSGSFSKSSSSSFASSSASSSSSSFSFSGSGAAGFGLNNLGSNSGGCTDGCKSGHSASNGNVSNGLVTDSNGLQSLSGAKSQAVAGAFAGSSVNSKDKTNELCANGICSGHKSPCDGPNCKTTSEECTSGQCGSKSSLPDHEQRDCTSGKCSKGSDSVSQSDSIDCKNGKCDENKKQTIPTYTGSNDNTNCASGQCGPQLPTSSGSENSGPNSKCTTGNCLVGSPATIPGQDHSMSTSSQNFDDHLSESDKASATTSQSLGSDCKFGNCNSPSLAAKPYGYSGSNTYNPHQPHSTAPETTPGHNKPATHLTVPKEEAPCSYPNCNEPNPQPTETAPLLSTATNCAGGYCYNGPSRYPKPQNTQFPEAPTSESKKESKPIQPNYGLSPSTQNGNDYPSPNCASENCDIQVSKTPTQSPDSIYSSNCASGNCDKSPVQPTGVGTLNPTIPSYSYKPTFSSNEPNVNTQGSKAPTFQKPFSAIPTNCAFGNCGNYPTAHSPGIISMSIPETSHPSLTGSSNCQSGICGTATTSHTLVSSYPRLPSYPQSIQSNKPLDCASGNCHNKPPSYSNTGVIASNFPNPSIQPPLRSPGCTSGNCGHTLAPQHGSFGSAGFQSPSYSTNNCASGNCANYPSTYHSATSATGSKLPIPSGHLPISSSPNCASGNCGSSPASQLEGFGSSGYQSASYPAQNCASGNCPNVPSPYPSAGPIVSKIPFSSGISSTSGCTSGKCGSSPTYQNGNFGSSGFQSPSYSGIKPILNCPSGNCGSSPSIKPGYTPSIGDIGFNDHSPSGESIPSVGPVPSGNCASGNCPYHPSTQTHQIGTSSTKPSDKFPDYVALGVAGGATKPATSGQSNSVSSHTTSNSVATGGIHSTQSSAFGSLKPTNIKDQLYTGGFGGPPGILNPYEFTAASSNLAPSSNKGSSCLTGKCDAQSSDDKFSDKHKEPHGSGPCTSGNCESQPGKPYNGQVNLATGAFAAAAAGSDAVIYTGGFGGPPGLLTPYDDGKNGNIAVITGSKHQSSSTGNYHHASGNKSNNDNGALSAAAATASAGAFGGGSYNGGHNKAGGCNSGCGSSGHGSFGGNFGLAGSASKSGLLDKLHNGVNAAVQSSASATSGAGASSFALGGSFASSSASAHSAAGSATKGGYGR